MSIPAYHTFIRETFGVELTPTQGNDYSIFTDVIQIVNPKRILETGFFKGASAFMLLHLSTAHLTSVDPMIPTNGTDKHDGSLENADVLSEMFRGRFSFMRVSSLDVRPHLVGQQFDLFNIDGDHLDAGIINDFQLAIDLNIPWIIVDDFILNVRDVYLKQFAGEFVPVRTYARDDKHEGTPIPRVLMRRRNPALPHLAYSI